MEKAGVEPATFRVRGGRSTRAELHPHVTLALRDSNPRPPRCKRGALPSELNASGHCIGWRSRDRTEVPHPRLGMCSTI